ncbi:MAG: DUF1573 domain-containing protein [Bacteroidales bacterium]|nr:DUF1573 domain-containing protein [Bacteroidales bacterium]
MKKVFFSLLACVFGLTVLAQTGPSIQFETKLHDFGDINEDDKTATCVFTFKNVGDGPLIIHRAVASCGCTTPEFTKEPIVPGGTGTVKVTYNTVGRPDAFHKTVTLYSNDPKTPNIILSIKGTVIPGEEDPELSYPRNMNGLRLDKTQVNVLDARIGSIRTETIRFINATSRPMRLSFRNVPPHIRVVASNTQLKPKESGQITLSYLASEARDYGRKEDNFMVVIDNDVKASANNLIHVSAYITEDFSRLTPDQRANAPVVAFSENRIHFGKMTQNTKKTSFITLENKGKQPLFIRKIVPEYDGLSVSPEKMVVPAGKSIRIKVTFNAGRFNGNVVQRATIFTNDPKNSLSRLFISATVQPN